MASGRVSDCDLPLAVGSRHVVFAQTAGGQLWARKHKGTRVAEDASELLC